MTDYDVIDQEDLFGDDSARGEQWMKSLCSDVLRRIAVYTKSEIAILRLVEFATGNLRLGGYAVTEESEADAKLRSQTFRIPHTKTIACWNGIDPLESWGFVKHTAHESDENAADWAQWREVEKNFVRWVREKAWFPLMLGERGSGFVVLVRGEVKGYCGYDIVRAWLNTQVAVSKSLQGPHHRGFVSAAAYVSNAFVAADAVTMMQVVCHCVASAYGLGWHRVWILKEDKGQFRCQAAIGEVSNDRWSAMLKSFSAASLADEMTAVIENKTYRSDGLFQSCCRPESPLAIEYGDDELELFFRNMREDVSERVMPLAQRLDDSVLGGARHFHERVSAHVRQSGFSYEADKQSFVLPLFIGQERYLVYLGHAYQGDLASPTLATIFLNHAGYVVKEWLTASSTAGAGGGAVSGDVARKAASLARVREAAFEFEQNEETRQKMATKAEEALRRAKQALHRKKEKVD